MRRRRKAGIALTGAALALAGVVAATAWAAQGDLTAQGCVARTVGGDVGCTQNVPGLGSVRRVAVSPDGTSVYAASQSSNAIVRLDRNASTGALTPQGCIEDAGPDTCATDTNGLAGAYGVAVSPDGTSVYVAAESDDAIVHFARNTSTGALTLQGCVHDEDTGTGGCSQTSPGLADARGVAVSADGASVYVAGQGDDAIVRFDRNTSTGALTPQGCVDDDDTGPDGCGQSTDGLEAVIGVTVSRDGKSVYGASTDEAIVHLTRNTGTGALAPQDCVEEPGFNPEDGCSISADALFDPLSVAVSHDNKTVYVAANGADAVVRFSRNTTTGVLTPQGCTDDEDTTLYASCSHVGKGMDGPADVVVSRDGGSVYVASQLDDAVSRFDRNKTTGALSTQNCIDENDAGQGPDDCAVSTDGLDGAFGIAASADRKSIYAVGTLDATVVRFDRDPGDIVPPETTIDAGPTGPTSDSTPSFSFSSEAGATFECRLDSDPFAECSGAGTHTPGGALGEGAHTFEVRASDDSDNTDASPASAAFSVDTVAPETSIASGPSGLTSDSTPSFAFTSDEGGVSFECSVDAGTYGACSGPGAAHTTGVLADGAHTFAVHAEDAAGNVSAAASRSFSVDATKPVVTLAKPTGEKGKITFAFTANEPVTFRCQLDQTAKDCASPTTYPLPKPGKHLLVVSGTDSAGNRSAPVVYQFKVILKKKKGSGRKKKIVKGS